LKQVIGGVKRFGNAFRASPIDWGVQRVLADFAILIEDEKAMPQMAGTLRSRGPPSFENDTRRPITRKIFSWIRYSASAAGG
jgi:hypothetical protein